MSPGIPPGVIAGNASKFFEVFVAFYTIFSRGFFLFQRFHHKFLLGFLQKVLITVEHFVVRFLQKFLLRFLQKILRGFFNTKREVEKPGKILK